GRSARQRRRERGGHGSRAARLDVERPAERLQHDPRRRARVRGGAPRAVPRAAMRQARVYAELARPFTLLMPMLGFFSGAVTAWGARHSRPPLTAEVVMPVVCGVLMAGIF